jgi:hypothetical protein
MTIGSLPKSLRLLNIAIGRGTFVENMSQQDAEERSDQVWSYNLDR